MSYSSRCMTEEDWKELKYFEKHEFKYPEKMGYEFMIWLDKVRGLAGVPMIVTSSYRTPEHNTDVGGAEKSAHMLVPCNAADFMPKDSLGRFYIIKSAFSMGGQRIGIYKNGSIHLDRAEDTHPRNVLWTVV